jgi:phospholipid-binding lipoprotein MlaA
MPIARSLAFLAALLLASACATTSTSSTTSATSNSNSVGDPRDPWESLNRKTFAFNDAVDRAVLKPVAHGYVAVTPVFVRSRISSFFDNLADVGTMLNDVLQGKFPQGVNDLGRIVVNTTFGVAGFWDVASQVGVERRDEDFGQTLAVWGVPSGPYFVIPFLGPSTARDAPARAVDPSWYWPRVIHNDSVYWSLWTLDKVRARASLLKAESIVEQAALDRYLFIRDAWLERRRSQIYDGKPPLEDEEK